MGWILASGGRSVKRESRGTEEEMCLNVIYATFDE